MKKGVVFILMLLILFLGALLIYDFSDIPDDTLTSHDWYLLENNEFYVLNLKDNKFSFKNLNNDSDKYKKCHTYKYNNSSNVIKLDCNIKGNKFYIATYDENKLVVTFNGDEKVLFSSQELALENKFILDNNISYEKYNSLLNVEIDDNFYIDYNEFLKYYKSKNKKNIGFVTDDINYKNVLNYNRLKEIIDESYLLINLNKLSENELKDIYKKIGINIYNFDLVSIYEIGNKKVKLINTIDIKNINDLDGDY